MDCEKFESTLMDELYGELDELTSAASKRHMAGCTRCASLLGGLKATRRVAVLPILETPPGLEAKILEAATEARKLVPLRGRVARAVSLAGSWAMKPQTAMAAVFLLMIGTGVAFFGGPKVSKSGSQAAMTITQEGAPAAMASAAPAGQTSDSLDLAAAANAHGTLQQDRAPTVAATATAAAVSPDLEAVAANDLPGSPAARADLANQPAAKTASAYASGPGGIGGGMMAEGAASAAPQAAPTTAAAPSSASSADFAAATAAYHAQNYDEATREFDALAAAGDDNAALWAARSVRDGNGCSVAVNRFDQLAGRAYGTPPGYDATFESGQCYKSMGAFDAARQRFARLLTVPSHAARAQAELNKMAPTSNAHQAAPRAKPAPAPANAQQMNNSAF
jgi:hypothetical protein